MSKFVTQFKTCYTNKTVSSENKGFISSYSSKSGRKAIAGENRSTGKKYASQLLK